MTLPATASPLNPMVQVSESNFDCWQLDVQRDGETLKCTMYFEFGTRGCKFRVDVPADALPDHPVDSPLPCTFTRIQAPWGQDMLTDVQLQPNGEHYPVVPLS